MSGALFFSHVAVLMMGILCFCGASLTALLHLLEHRAIKTKRPSRLSGLFPPLNWLDRFTVRTLWVGFAFLTVGMLTGIYLAHGRWKGDWVANPKFLISVASWLFYVVLLLVRYRFGWRGGRFFALTAVGFFLLLFTFVAITYLTEAGGM